MCVLIHKPADKTVAASLVHLLAKRNSDGIGIAIADPQSGITLWRTMSDVAEAARRIEAATPFPALIHFRLSTHGTKTVDNVHPFFFPGRTDMVYGHNGIISEMPRESARSDTRVFGEEILAQLRDGWWSSPGTVKAIEGLLGHNKVAIMHADGTATILNESKGDRRADGVWFSNTQYRGAMDDGHRAMTPPSMPWRGGFDWSGDSRMAIAGWTIVDDSIRFLFRRKTSAGEQVTFSGSQSVRSTDEGALEVIADMYADRYELEPCTASPDEPWPSSWLDLPVFSVGYPARSSAETDVPLNCAVCAANYAIASDERLASARSLSRWSPVIRLGDILSSDGRLAEVLPLMEDISCKCTQCGEHPSKVIQRLLPHLYAASQAESAAALEASAAPTLATDDALSSVSCPLSSD